MQILMKGLSITENKAGDIKFLNEAFIRFNFNYYYHADLSAPIRWVKQNLTLYHFFTYLQKTKQNFFKTNQFTNQIKSTINFF